MEVYTMRWFKWMGMLLGVAILLGACSSKKLSESDQLLVDYLVQDYQTYFDFPLVLNDFSATVQKGWGNLLIKKQMNRFMRGIV